MDERIHALLLSVDEVDAWENPRNLDYHAFWRELEALKPLVEQVLSQTCSFDRYVQDASFFTDIYTERKPIDEQRLRSDWSIRFSSFGCLVSLDGAVIHDPDRQDQKCKLIALLESQQFHYIPADELEELYDGVNPPYEGLTWLTRYFNYL